MLHTLTSNSTGGLRAYHVGNILKSYLIESLVAKQAQYHVYFYSDSNHLREKAWNKRPFVRISDMLLIHFVFVKGSLANRCSRVLAAAKKLHSKEAAPVASCRCGGGAVVKPKRLYDYRTNPGKLSTTPKNKLKSVQIDCIVVFK